MADTLTNVSAMLASAAAQANGVGVLEPPTTSPPLSDMEHSFALAEELSCSHGVVMNITKVVPIEYARVMYGGIMPFLVATTLLSNSLTIRVLTRPHMRSPTNLVLLWLAITDLLTLISPAPMYFYMYTLGQHRILPAGREFCYLFDVMTEHVPMMFHTTSIWLTILLAGQRYIYICHPTLAKTIITMQKVQRTIIATFLTALSVQLCRFIDTAYDDAQCRPTMTSAVADNNNSTLVACCTKYASPTFHSYFDSDYYYPAYFGFRVVFVNLGPCIALIVLNFMLFRALKVAKAKRQKLLNGGAPKSVATSGTTSAGSAAATVAAAAQRKRKRNDLSNSTTYMLMVVVSVFLLVELPMAFAILIHLLANTGVLMFEGDSHLHYLKLVVILCNFVIMLSFPVNFAIYTKMSTPFRNTLVVMFQAVPGLARLVGGGDAENDNEGEPATTRTTVPAARAAGVADGPKQSTQLAELNPNQLGHNGHQTTLVP